MSSLSIQLVLAQDALGKAEEAQKALNSLLAEWRNSNAGEIISPAQLRAAADGIHSFARTITEVAIRLDRKIKERKAKLDGATVLEAAIRCGSESRKIVVAKPNDRIDEPYIPESFYTAIRDKWTSDEPITTTAGYDIIVVNRKGKPIGVIANR